MKPSSPSLPAESPLLLVFGAHPDDIEFGCGGVIAAETQAGAAAHLVVCSRGEAGSHGTPAERVAEAAESAQLLGASVEFLAMGGDAHLEDQLAHRLAFARIIRRVRPRILLAPTTVDQQHPDHAVVGRLARDAARLARYAGVEELLDLPPHAVQQLYFYAVTVEGEPKDLGALLVDVSGPATLAAWKQAMAAHVTQSRSRNYVELQLARARANGLRAGVEFAIALFPSAPLLVGSLTQLSGSARAF